MSLLSPALKISSKLSKLVSLACLSTVSGLCFSRLLLVCVLDLNAFASYNISNTVLVINVDSDWLRRSYNMHMNYFWYPDVFRMWCLV